MLVPVEHEQAVEEFDTPECVSIFKEAIFDLCGVTPHNNGRYVTLTTALSDQTQMTIAQAIRQAFTHGCGS